MTLYEQFTKNLAEGIGVAVATVIAGPHSVGSKLLVYGDESVEGTLPVPELTRRVAGDAALRLQAGDAFTQEYDLADGRFTVFIDVYPSPLQLVIVGATHVAGPLVKLAKLMGYRVVVADARAAFAQQERYPEADAVLKGWPQDVLPGMRFDRSTAVVLLSHDPKFDEPTLQHVLPTEVPYIGAIGSRKTQAERFDRLRAEGYTEAQLARVYGPIGLDLGGRSAEETALAIMAEVTAVRHGRSGGSLKAGR